MEKVYVKFNIDMLGSGVYRDDKGWFIYKDKVNFIDCVLGLPVTEHIFDVFEPPLPEQMVVKLQNV